MENGQLLIAIEESKGIYFQANFMSSMNYPVCLQKVRLPSIRKSSGPLIYETNFKKKYPTFASSRVLDLAYGH